MNWIVVDHNGVEHKATGSDPWSAATSLADRLLGKAEENLGKQFVFIARRPKPDINFREPVRVVLETRAYWTYNFEAKYGRAG